MRFQDHRAYAERYRLLLAGLMERQSDHSVQADGRALRADAIREIVARLEHPDSSQDAERLNYRLAYAMAAQAESLGGRPESPRTEISALLEGAARAFMRAAGGENWFYERATLGGKNDYITPVVNDLDERARLADMAGEMTTAKELRAQALAYGVQLARLDRSTLGALRQRFERIRSGESFDDFWTGEIVRGHD